jgi:hypothetical protein
MINTLQTGGQPVLADTNEAANLLAPDLPAVDDRLVARQPVCPGGVRLF